MSQLRKLKRHARRKAELPKRTIQSPEEVKIQQKNAAFRLLTGTYVLLQRVLAARDIIYIEKRNPRNGRPERIHEPVMDALMYNLVQSIEKIDEFYRDQVIVSTSDDVSPIDIVSHYYYTVISNMELMNENDLKVIQKVSETITTADRYMHIDSEEAYLNNILISVQHGMDLGNSGRKRATMNDVMKLVKPNEKGGEK